MKVIIWNIISFKDLVVCLLLFCSQNTQGKYTRLNKTNEFILGGKPALTPIPYQVSYQLLAGKRWFHNCGGAIISLHHVLTAAHCVKGKNSETYILAGTIYVHVDGPRYSVAWAKSHPKYIGLNRHDIAVLRIQGTFIWSDHVQPIAFNSKKFYPGGELVWVSGWGYTDRNGTILANTLQYLGQRTMHNKDCKRFWKDMDYGRICTMPDYGQGSCGGDSGGPLVNAEQNLLVGIVSYGTRHCGIGTPDVYTRVSSYVDWIERTMHEISV